MDFERPAKSFKPTDSVVPGCRPGHQTSLLQIAAARISAMKPSSISFQPHPDFRICRATNVAERLQALPLMHVWSNPNSSRIPARPYPPP